MEALLYFALWGGLFFLMMRFGCGAHVVGRRAAPTETPRETGEQAALRWVPPAKDTDPVCGKTVRTEAAKSSVYGGAVFYFCSRECREVFEAAPDLYVSPGASVPPKLERTHA